MTPDTPSSFSRAAMFLDEEAAALVERARREPNPLMSMTLQVEAGACVRAAVILRRRAEIEVLHNQQAGRANISSITGREPL